MLIAHHNITPRGLEIAHEIGGIPMPSIAISKVAHPIRKFGSISLIAPPSLITPGRNVGVWPSDAYTGCQPRAEMAFKDPKKAMAALKADPEFGHLNIFGSDFERANDDMKLAQYAKDKFGIDPKRYQDAYDIQREIRDKPGFDWNETKNYPGIKNYGDFSIELPPMDRFTPSGNRRKNLPYTMKNVYEQMKKAKAYQQGAEDWDYGPSSFRARSIRPFKSLSAIQSGREKIIHPNDMQAIKDEFSNRYFQAGQPEHDPELAAYARSLPTEYFEAKRKDIVPLSSFGAALVPHGDDRSTQILRDAGVSRVLPYHGGDDARDAWMRTMKDFHFRDGGYAR